MAYANGYFPMAHQDEENRIYWHRPSLRAVFVLNSFTPKIKLQKLLSTKQFTFAINTAFEQVIRNCADRPDTWISEDIIEKYIALHKMGYAYSFETWRFNELVGGLYGIVLGRVFFGESMFYKVPDASKAAFAFLVQELKSKDFLMIDSQYLNDYTASLGAVEISDEAYMKILTEALQI